MPKTKKQQRPDSSNDSDSDSGPEDKNPPAKKSKPDSSRRLKNAEGDSYWELDRQKRITVRDFRGKVLIDIREYYEKDGKMLPGKKGISLPVSLWGTLKSVMDEVDEAISDKA